MCLLFDYHGNEACDDKLPPPSAPNAFIDQTGAVRAEWAWFPEAANLEFVNASLRFDTTSIGLRCDGWRRHLPVAAKYRPWVKAAFEGVPSTASGEYSPEAAAIRAGLASGKALVQTFTEPCPPPPAAKTECRAYWLAWGECEADGLQTMRYTIEDEPSAGALPCAYTDGYSQRQPC